LLNELRTRFSMPPLWLAPVLLALSAGVMVSIASSGNAATKGDAAAGKLVYAQCMSCHKIDKSGKSGIGPNLYKVIGRRAGTLTGFRYSPAMVASGRVWTEEALDAYLISPAKALPGGRMPYAGLRNPADRANVIAYIKSVSK
jgi:cytochrome c